MVEDISSPGVKGSRPGGEGPSSGDKTVVDPNSPVHRQRAQARQAAAAADATVIDPDSPVHRQRALESARARSAEPAVVMQATERPAESPPAEGLIALRIGHRLLEYRIDSVLGQGGFGVTYVATDVNLNAKVAVKEYLPEQFAFRRQDLAISPREPGDRELYQHGLESFLVEARTLATFRHPNIVRVARFFEANSTAYMVLEYERGKSLKTWWRAHANVPERELLTLLLPLLDGLAVVHETGFLHRDIKPDNICVRDEDGSLVLLDFGAARQTARLQADDTKIVTPGYGPIEQYTQSEQGPWTDIYALGATLYWMISGNKPIDAPERIAQGDPLPPALEVGRGRFSEEFLRAVDWALKPEPRERPQDIAQFRVALYAAHASSLGLQEALRAGERVELAASESWLTVLRSPRQLRGRLIRFWRSLVQPSSWPIAVKMMLAMVATALAPMLLTAYYNLNATIARVNDSELRNLEQLAASVAGRVSQLIGDSGNLAGYLGADEDFVAFLSNPTLPGKVAMKAKLDGLVKANPDVHLLILMDTAGTAIVSSDPEVVGRNFGFREYFKVAMQGRPFTTGIVVGAVAGLAGIFYSHPVFDAQGKVIGVVVLRIRAASVAAILEQARRGNERIPFLLDRDGVVIYHPNRQVRYRSLVPLPDDKLDAIVADQRFRRNNIESMDMPDLAKAMVGAQTGGNISYFSTISSKHEIAGYAPVKGSGWVVGVTEPRETFAAPINELFDNVLYSVVLVGAAFLLLAMLFARSIVRPIEELTGAAHALKGGNYEKANIKVTSRDEIGHLARTFNVMIDVLRQRERERRIGSRRSRSLGSGAEEKR